MLSLNSRVADWGGKKKMLYISLEVVITPVFTKGKENSSEEQKRYDDYLLCLLLERRTNEREARHDFIITVTPS